MLLLQIYMSAIRNLSQLWLSDDQGSLPKKSVGTAGTRIEVPKGMGCPPLHWGGSGEGAQPRKKFRFWISNRQILLQTGCLRSSTKAGLNAVVY